MRQEASRPSAGRRTRSGASIRVDRACTCAALRQGREMKRATRSPAAPGREEIPPPLQPERRDNRIPRRDDANREQRIDEIQNQKDSPPTSGKKRADDRHGIADDDVEERERGNEHWDN